MSEIARQLRELEAMWTPAEVLPHERRVSSGHRDELWALADLDIHPALVVEAV